MGADADSTSDAVDDDEGHPTDEEQVETEWHLWLFAILLFGGVTLIIFPPTIWPNVGFALVGVAVVGWILKTILEKTIR